MINQLRSKKWIGGVKQHTIIWANVDPYLWRDMASRGHNGLTNIANNDIFCSFIIEKFDHIYRIKLFAASCRMILPLDHKAALPWAQFVQAVFVVSTPSYSDYSTNYYSTAW